MQTVRFFAGTLLSALIVSGANISESAVRTFTPKQKAYWAFQPVRAQQLPAVQHQTWIRNPIDAFILAKLEDKKIAPSAEETSRRCSAG